MGQALLRAVWWLRSRNNNNNNNNCCVSASGAANNNNNSNSNGISFGFCKTWVRTVSESRSSTLAEGEPVPDGKSK